MVLEWQRILTDWLKDATYGVNAKLAVLVLDGADTRPGPVTDVVDESRNAMVARDRIPDNITLPLLLVTMVEPAAISTEVETTYRDVRGRVAIRYAGEEKDSEKGTQAAMYTLRAVLQSLNALMGAPGTTARVRNNQVELVQIGELSWVPVYQAEGERAITGGLLLDCHVRDLQA